MHGATLQIVTDYEVCMSGASLQQFQVDGDSLS